MGTHIVATPRASTYIVNRLTKNHREHWRLAANQAKLRARTSMKTGNKGGARGDL